MNKWNIVTAGHLSRNKFWGEDEYSSNHPVLATSTIIQSEFGNILVDPSMNAEDMQKAVYDSCGLKPEEINIIYSTHFHNDHWMGVEGFPNAEFYMAKDDLLSLLSLRDCVAEETRRVLDRVKPASGELIEGFQLIPLPGHTAGLQGLLFDAPEGKVLICGDSVMGYEFFQAKQGYFYSYSLEKCVESIQKASEIADIIVPGHGNYFSVKAYPFNELTEEKPDETYLGIPQNGKYSIETTIGEILSREDGLQLFEEHITKGFPLMALKMSAYLPIRVLAKSMGLNKEQLEKFIMKM